MIQIFHIICNQVVGDLQVAELVVNNNLPLRFVEYKEHRTMVQTMYKEGSRRNMSSKRLKHIVYEMWAHVITKITLMLKTERQANQGMPFISLNFDGYQNKISGQKYLGLRAYYVVENAETYKLHSVLLAMKPFSPTYAMRAQGLVNVQLEYVKHVLESFSISTTDLFGGVSDAGKDVKSLLTQRLHLDWEWCIAHEMTCAVKVRQNQSQETA